MKKPPLIIDLNDERQPAKPVSPARSGKHPAWLRKATAAAYVHDFRRAYQELPEFLMYEQLCVAVSLHYFEDGLKAAIHMSCLSQTEEAGYFYAAVHRYPKGQAQRQVVCEARGSSLLQAIRNVAAVWLEQIKYEGKEVAITRALTDDPDELIEQLQASIAALNEKGKDI